MVQVAAMAHIQSLVWKCPYATGEAKKKKKRKEKEKKKKKKYSSSLSLHFNLSVTSKTVQNTFIIVLLIN